MGEADLAIGTEPQHDHPRLVDLPCFTMNRIVVAPDGHPILDNHQITIEQIAEYPIITYDSRFSGYWKVRSAFERAGLEPRVVLSAIDAGVCKTYVRMGLGLAILSELTFDQEHDYGLRAINAEHLFDPSMTSVRLRPNLYLRPYLLDFIRRCGPKLTADVVREMIDDHEQNHSANL
jgi:LysR family cys regulon transcriptional activator